MKFEKPNEYKREELLKVVAAAHSAEDGWNLASMTDAVLDAGYRKLDGFYSADMHVPKEGTIDAEGVQRMIENWREVWVQWLDRLVKNGPNDMEATSMLFQVGSHIKMLDNMRHVYFHYPPEDYDTKG